MKNFFFERDLFGIIIFILENTTVTNSSRRQSSDCYQERQRLYPSNGHIRFQPDEFPYSAERKLLTRKISTSCVDSLRSGNEYLARLSHPRLSTPSISNEYVMPSGHTFNHHQTISQRTTKMLVICSTTFLLFNSPYCAVLFYSILSKHVLTRALDILRYFYFMSFCLNFFLYSLCGYRFRHELIVLSKKFCRKCCSENLRQRWSILTKLPNRSSISRTTARTAV